MANTKLRDAESEVAKSAPEAFAARTFRRKGSLRLTRLLNQFGSKRASSIVGYVDKSLSESWRGD